MEDKLLELKSHPVMVCAESGAFFCVIYGRLRKGLRGSWALDPVNGDYTVFLFDEDTVERIEHVRLERRWKATIYLNLERSV